MATTFKLDTTLPPPRPAPHIMLEVRADYGAIRMYPRNHAALALAYLTRSATITAHMIVVAQTGGLIDGYTLSGRADHVDAARADIEAYHV